MSNLCIIPARGGSKRIPRKNIKLFLGKPIISYSIKLAFESGLFDEIMVSTDDNEIAEIAKQYGAKVPFFRSEKCSNDYSTTTEVLNEVVTEYDLQGFKFKKVCCIYPTAVLAKVNDLVLGYEMLENSDMVMPITNFSFPPARSLYLKKDGFAEFRFPEHVNSRSQDLEPWFHDAGQWYWFHVNSINKPIEKMRRKTIFKSNELVQDIDTIDDWYLAEMKFNLK